MSVGTVSITVACENVSWSQTLTDAGGGIVKHSIPAVPSGTQLPAGLAGSSVHGATDSVITVASGHGITTADKVGVFGTFGKRLGMTVSAYDGTSITVTNSTGTGDAYPSGTVAVVVGKPTDIPDIAFDGDSAVFILATCDQISAIDLIDSGAAHLVAGGIGINAAGGAYYWSYSSGVARPVTGNPVADGKVYNGSIVAATFTFLAILST